uniref:Semaphorin-1A n=1 Tax=Scleropages formosus TaxID=113540 RepID=A0A8C9V0H9_SCLFO
MKYLVLSSLFLLAFAGEGPRLRFTLQEPGGFQFAKPELYTTVKQLGGDGVIYVGGQAALYLLRFTEDKGVQHAQIPILSDKKARETCLSRLFQPQECDNFITVIEKVDDHVLVCGTNAGAPRCWLLVNGTELTDPVVNGQVISASDMSPPFPSQTSVNLAADGDLYSAVSAEGNHPGFIRRTFGPHRLAKTENKWLQNAQFAGAAVIPDSRQHKEEIYFFFSEVNRTAGVDEQPYRARVGRLCLVDEGGIKGTLEGAWTTFLKARMMCGFDKTQKQFNSLKQAFVLTDQEKRAGVVYGLFANAWDTTVVCAYSVEDINQAFTTSRLKGYRGSLPGHRPGMCVFKNVTSSLGARALAVIRDHPEIEDVIKPVDLAPLDLPTQRRFTKIAADMVLAVNEEHYSVVYLGTENGQVLKVLHTSEEAFIISQYSLFQSEGPITAMTIDSRRGYLYVSTPAEVQRMPLADCGRYGDSCRGCVLSRDPYCGWDVVKRKCVAVPEGYNISTRVIVQSLDQSNGSECDRSTGGFADLRAHSTSPKEVVVEEETPVLLPCPVYSFHAKYHWEKDNCAKHYPCSIIGPSCVLLPTPLLPLTEGIFRCMGLEDNHKVELVSYRVIFNGGPAAAAVGYTLGASLFLAASTFCLI